MKKLFIVFLFLTFGCGISYALDDSEYSWQGNSNNTYDINSGQFIDDTYFRWDNKTQSYTTYKQNGNDIHGSDGSHYRRLNNIIQDDRGHLYEIQGNTVYQMY